MPVLAKEVECMLEDGRTSLYAIVHPACAIEVLVDIDRSGLSTDYRHALDDGDVEFVWVLGKSCCAGLWKVSVPTYIERG